MLYSANLKAQWDTITSFLIKLTQMSFYDTKYITSLGLLVLLLACNDQKESARQDQNQNLATQNVKPILRPRFDYSILEDGDIVLKRGLGQVSVLIIKFLGEKIPLSHCGIIIKEAEQYFVIHSLAKEYSGIDGMQKTSLTYFLEDAQLKDTYFVRHKSPLKPRKQIAKKAADYLKEKVPFDYNFDNSDTTTFYCLEFLDHTLKTVLKKDLVQKKKIGQSEALLLNSFLDTTNFEIIKH